jgi:hypothetical protein
VTAVPVLNLPPKVTVTDEVDDEGTPTGEKTIDMQPRVPGEGGHVNLEWGPYFQPSPADQNQLITALNMATGGKAILAQQTANEILAASFGRNPAEEWKRLTGDRQAEAAQNAAQMAAGGAFGGDPGGKVDGENDLPPGASPSKGDDEDDGSGNPFGSDSSGDDAKSDDKADT